MDSDDLPDWLPADWNVQIITGEQRHVKCYVDPQGHKCYSKPQVFEYLRKMGKIPANENGVMQDNGDGSTVDLSMDPNAPDSNEILPESLPGGQLTKLTPRTSRKKSKPTGGSSSVAGSPHEPLSSQRYHGDSSWLPEGWTVEVRTRQSGTSSGMKFKCYTDPISGQKFFSKPQVLNHLAKTNRSVDGQNEVSTDPSSPTQISTWETEGTLADNGSPSEPLSSQRKDGDSSWLPEGWTVELKARKGGTNVGKNYKIFIDPISGHKFFSKPQVLNHLAKINSSAGGQKEGFTEPIIASPISSWRDNSATEVDNNENKTESARLSSGYEVFSRTPVEGLPPGWIQETRLRKHGVTRKDPYYIDPLSEYVFFSKKDALRYLESGNINSCVLKPLKRDRDKDSCYVDPQGHKCYSKPQVFEYLRKMGKIPANENTVMQDNGDGSIVDLSMDPNAPDSNEIPESLPGGQLTKLTPRTSRRKSKPTGGSSSVDGSPHEPLSSQRYRGDSSWLPEGWTVEVRTRLYGTSSGMKFKCYTDPISGQKFFSKPQVLNHLAKTNRSVDGQNEVSTDPSSPTQISTWETEGTLAGNGSPSEPLSSQRKDGDSSWLPEGWSVELKARKGGTNVGKNYMIFIDPISGQKFFSKPQVLNYLAKTNGSAGGQKEGITEPIIASPISSWRDNSATEVDNNENKTESARLSSGYEVFSRTPVEGLPPGWIQEARLRKHGVTRKDPYYIDPLSEYVFFSKKDALRYLESGNINSCVLKPLKRDRDKDSNMTSTEEEMDLPSDPSKQIEISEELPNDTVPELNTNGSGIENPKPIRSITGGDFSTLIASRKEVRSIYGGIFSSPKEEKLERLPDGWDVEVRYKSSGVQYKIYKETATGIKLYSKPQVLKYLNGSISNSRKRKV